MVKIEDNLVIKLYRDGSKLSPKIPVGVSRREMWVSLMGFWDYLVCEKLSDFGDELEFSGKLASQLGVEFLEKYFTKWVGDQDSKKCSATVLTLILCGMFFDRKSSPPKVFLEIALNKSSVVRKINKLPMDSRNAIRGSIIFSMCRAWNCLWAKADIERIELMAYLCLFTYGRGGEMSSSDRECLERMLGEDVVARVVKNA